jgi:hypothetical protein
MDMNVCHGHTACHEHAVWTRKCNTDMDMQHEDGHAAWTWTLVMDKEGHIAGMLTLILTWTWTWT